MSGSCRVGIYPEKYLHHLYFVHLPQTHTSSSRLFYWHVWRECSLPSIGVWDFEAEWSSWVERLAVAFLAEGLFTFLCERVILFLVAWVTWGDEAVGWEGSGGI